MSLNTINSFTFTRVWKNPMKHLYITFTWKVLNSHLFLENILITIWPNLFQHFTSVKTLLFAVAGLFVINLFYGSHIHLLLTNCLVPLYIFQDHLHIIQYIQYVSEMGNLLSSVGVFWVPNIQNQRSISNCQGTFSK